MNAPEDELPIPLATAVRRGLLSHEQADRLAGLTRVSGENGLDLAVRQGLLTSCQADMLHALVHPEQLVAGYRILDVLGMGGMAVVYKACQSATGRIVALKTIRVSHQDSDEIRARFENEAVLIAALNHPNIVAFLDFFQDGARFFLVMEYVDGPTLGSCLNQALHLPEATVWSIGRQVTEALAHAWVQQIVHRDVKPGNILLSAAPESDPPGGRRYLAKLADFGLALLAPAEGCDPAGRRPTTATGPIGTPDYLAPEQARGIGFDFRVDLYSLGATLFHALTGRPPFQGGSAMEILSQKLGRPAPAVTAFVPHLSKSTADLIDRLLARRPDDRPGSHQELLAAIDVILAELGHGGDESFTLEFEGPHVLTDTQETPVSLSPRPAACSDGNTPLPPSPPDVPTPPVFRPLDGPDEQQASGI